MAKLAALATLLALLGTVSCQIQSAPAYPPSASSSSPTATITYPPGASPSQSIYLAPSPVTSGPSPLAYPPTLDVSAPSHSSPAYPPASAAPSSSTPIYLPSPSPSTSSPTAPTYPPQTSSLAYPPIPSTSSPSQPTYPPNLSPQSPNSISYPPSPSPSLDGPSPAVYPPISNPPTNSPSPAVYPPISTPPTNSPSPSTLPYPPSPSPGPTSPAPAVYPPISIPPTYSPSPSPGPSSPAPAVYPPISIPPTYSPSPSPGPSSPAPAVYPLISIPPTYSPSPSPGPVDSGLSVGHYSYSCPNAEAIVRDAVKNAIDSNRGTGAGLIRLFFHDCFVRGCDASVLLNTTGSSEATERLSRPNLTLRGFEVIDAAKSALEESCPGIVSCSDILAFAGRDATYYLTNLTTDFDMPAGRYDGLVSLANETVPNLPAPFYGLQELNNSFAAKGLSLEDMVTLSGAHSVGRSSCSSFSDRISSNTSDMDAGYARYLRKQCSAGGGSTAAQDYRTPDDLDREYYRDVVGNAVLFGSDAALMASNETARMVVDNASVRGLWESKFAAAMVKMGDVGVKTSADGEIRKKCWIIN